MLKLSSPSLQMFYDNLPVWGFIGKVENIRRPGKKPEQKLYLFTHIHFDLAYNADRVIEVNTSTVNSDPKKTVDITDGESVKVQFSYSVKWRPTKITYDNRMDRYAYYSFLPQHLEVSSSTSPYAQPFCLACLQSQALAMAAHGAQLMHAEHTPPPPPQAAMGPLTCPPCPPQIHWFSIINSCVTVVLLTGFLATILLRVLKNDFVKYTRDDEMGEEQEETGWKYLHGDVFRCVPEQCWGDAAGPVDHNMAAGAAAAAAGRRAHALHSMQPPDGCCNQHHMPPI
jgi:hypothetical protein